MSNGSGSFMSSNLKSLIVALGEDPTVLSQYILDPSAVIIKFELSDQEAEALISGDEGVIRGLIGEDKFRFGLMKLILHPPKNRLLDFIVELGENSELLQSYISDPVKTMDDFGLDEIEKAALLSGDEHSIREILDVQKNDFSIKKLILHPPEN